MSDFTFYPSQTSPETLERWIGVLESKLLQIVSGCCTCNTKSPTLEFHTESCAFRLAPEALDTLDEIKEAVSGVHVPNEKMEAPEKN